jgi:hypothetical protein
MPASNGRFRALVRLCYGCAVGSIVSTWMLPWGCCRRTRPSASVNRSQHKFCSERWNWCEVANLISQWPSSYAMSRKRPDSGLTRGLPSIPTMARGPAAVPLSSYTNREGFPLETWLDVGMAAERAARQLELAADPDQGGRVSPGSLQEAHVILALVETGELPGPIIRLSDRGDCTDAAGQDWDVKRPRDDVRRPQFDVGRFLEGKIRYEVECCRENVIVDLTGLTNPVNRRALRAAVDDARLTAHVRWYE